MNGKFIRGFALLEVVVATAVFLLFALGVYGGTQLIFKIVYQSRMRILETSILSEELEVVRNLKFDEVGVVGGIPDGVLEHEKTVTRNNTIFNITTTVRNIDDPFDGTIGGTPNDTAPADYKLAEMSIICSNCNQQEPVILSTLVSPKNFEGESDNGALFVHVFDMNGLPVSSASVHIENTNAEPDIIINEVTDNDGMLRVIDTPTGTFSYNITVSKFGYSSDYTISPTSQNPYPTKLPSTVASQYITEINFSIDHTGNMLVKTLSPSCSALANKTFSIYGNKIIGVDPTIYKFDGSHITDGSGEKDFANMEWDHYYLSASGTAYDLAGSIPMSPVHLTPGLSQDVSLVLRAHSDNSLLVKVKDAGTGLPLSDVFARLTGTGYDESLSTDLGYTRQTDWSCGGGQSDFINENQYFIDNGNLETDSPDGDLKLKKVSSRYLMSGWLESSTFDLGAGVNFRNIIWEPLAQPEDTGVNSVLFQIATDNSPNPASWEFIGPDGASTTFYTTTSTLIYNGNNGRRYMRYRVYLNTEDDRYTPMLSEVAFTFTNNCTPPGQVFFYGFLSGNYNLEVSRSGYISSSGPLDISGNMDVVVNLSPS